MKDINPSEGRDSRNVTLSLTHLIDQMVISLCALAVRNMVFRWQSVSLEIHVNKKKKEEKRL